MSPSTMRRRLCTAMLAMPASLPAVACTPADRAPVPAVGSASPVAVPSATTKTIRDSRLGDRLIITAALVAVISEHSFIIDDVDLPDQGLLVLGTLPDGARPRDLLTVRGVVAAFDFEHFTTIYGLDQQPRYQAFQGRKILVAQDVRSWS